MATEANPRKTFDFFLDPDTDKPTAQRRALICRFLTTGEFHETVDAFDAIIDAVTETGKAVEFGQQTAKLLESIVVSWRNITSIDGDAIEYGEGSLLQLSRGDFTMARADLLNAMEVAEDDLKKSLSPVQSDTGASAPDAEAANV